MDDPRKEMLRTLGYSEKAIGVLDAELHYGELADPTVQVRHQAGCGEILILDLLIENDVIQDAAFRFVGCSGLKATASGLSEMIIGLTIEEAERIGVHEIVNWLEGIPRNKYESAETSRLTLRKALEKYRDEHPLTRRLADQE